MRARPALWGARQLPLLTPPAPETDLVLERGTRAAHRCGRGRFPEPGPVTETKPEDDGISFDPYF